MAFCITNMSFCFSSDIIVFFWFIPWCVTWYCRIQLQYPVYWDLLEFCDGFRKLLDHLQLDKVRCIDCFIYERQEMGLFHNLFFVLCLCRCICSVPLWEDSWLRNLLKSRINLPEFILWSCATHLATHRSSTRHGQQTGRDLYWIPAVVTSPSLWICLMLYYVSFLVSGWCLLSCSKRLCLVTLPKDLWTQKWQMQLTLWLTEWVFLLYWLFTVLMI